MIKQVDKFTAVLTGEDLNKYLAKRFPELEEKGKEIPLMSSECVMAVSRSAEVTPEEAIDLIINEDWLCLTDEEADEMARDYILDCVWAFNPSFLSKHTRLDESIFEALQDKCEGANDLILSAIKDKEYFVEDAISHDGRGHFISFYDGIEYEQYIKDDFLYCYRMN